MANSTSGGDCFGASDGGYNLVEDGSCGVSAANNSLSGDPDLGPLADNGGPTKTMALEHGSKAIDKGKSFGENTDQRGESRPFNFPSITNAPGGDGSDIGAFEVHGDTRPPRVISTVPTDGAKGVPPSANIKADFSEDMNASCISFCGNGGAFKLFKKGSTTKVGATLSYNPNLDRAVLNPNNSLQRGVTYKAIVTTAARDEAGNRLDQKPGVSGLQPKVWFFKVSE